jgi:hypothetical protein
VRAEEWVKNALDAADDQTGQVAVEDDEVLTVVADAMAITRAAAAVAVQPAETAAKPASRKSA